MATHSSETALRKLVSRRSIVEVANAMTSENPKATLHQLAKLPQQAVELKSSRFRSSASGIKSGIYRSIPALHIHDNPLRALPTQHSHPRPSLATEPANSSSGTPKRRLSRQHPSHRRRSTKRHSRLSGLRKGRPSSAGVVYPSSLATSQETMDTPKQPNRRSQTAENDASVAMVSNPMHQRASMSSSQVVRGKTHPEQPGVPVLVQLDGEFEGKWESPDDAARMHREASGAALRQDQIQAHAVGIRVNSGERRSRTRRKKEKHVTAEELYRSLLKRETGPRIAQTVQTYTSDIAKRRQPESSMQ